MIDAYIDELRDTLRGPRSARTDLLTEARDSLIDAAERYEREGLDRRAAERAAVREFGEVPAVAPDYQAELGLSQARRTALLLFVVIGAQTLLSELMWRSASTGWGWEPPLAYMVLARAVDWASYAVLGGSALVVIACGFGMRFVHAGRRVVRATGVGAITACAFFSVGGLALTAFSPMTLSVPTSALGLMTMAMSWLPPVWLALSGHRCIQAA